MFVFVYTLYVQGVFCHDWLKAYSHIFGKSRDCVCAALDIYIFSRNGDINSYLMQAMFFTYIYDFTGCHYGNWKKDGA